MNKETDTIKQFKVLGTQPRIFLACLMVRHCISAFAIDLEYTHYNPKLDGPGYGQGNDEYQVMQLVFGDHPWIVISLPLEDRGYADEIAAKYGLRIADGVPFVYQQGNVCAVASHRKPPKESEVFPISNDNVFTVEYNTHIRHYERIKSMTPKQLLKEEQELIDSIYARHGVRPPS